MRRFSQFIVLSLIASFSFSSYATLTANAVTINDWRAGNIINDATFSNGTDMSVQQIQSFLNKRLPYCDTKGSKTSELGGGTRAQYGAANGNPAPFTCLTGYYEVPKTSPSPSEPVNNYGQYNSDGSPYVPAGSISAAQIIYSAAMKYSINPKALIVKLATESPGPLTSDEWPFKRQYLYAMGAHCPDSGPGGAANCDSNYSGFSLQMDEAAKLLRGYLTNMSQPWWPYKKPFAVNSVLWNVVERGCGAGDVYIESKATAALYTYTPYQPNRTALLNMYGTGDNCSAYGNRNFWRVWNDWFGLDNGPVAFKAEGSSTIYIRIDNIKLMVPHMAILQDYGISPDTISTVSQTYIDSISSPAADSGISPAIGHLVKSTSDLDADGGSIYLISLGKAYKIGNMNQFYSFGFKESDIKYIPLSYINSKYSGQTLSDYVTSPYGSVFEVFGGAKRLILNYPTYTAKNPSDKITPLSYYLADSFTSGYPLSLEPSLFKLNSGDAVWVYTNDKFYTVPTYDAFRCWGFQQSSAPTLYRTPSDAYVSTITPTDQLSCLTVSSDNQLYYLNGSQRVRANQLGGMSSKFTPTDQLKSLVDNMPLRDTELRSFIKTPDSAGIWNIHNGIRRYLTYSTYKELSLADTSIDTVFSDAISQTTQDGAYAYNGQLIKSASSSAVYLVYNDQRIIYSSANTFNAYGNNWNNITSFPDEDIDKSYPYRGAKVSDVVVDKSKNIAYLVTINGVFQLDSTTLKAMGISVDNLSASQPYDITVFKSLSLSSLRKATQFIKSPSSSLVYYAQNGTKRPISTYSALLTLSGGSEPTVMVLSQDFVDNLAPSAQ